jgi:hypothetical protein
MSLSMYDLSVPKFKLVLTTLKGILQQAVKYSEEKKLAPEVLPATRLIADMYPLAKQIQVVSDQAKGCTARLAGVEIPSMQDTEKTLPELIERLDKTLAFINTVTADQINGSESKEIVLEFPSLSLKFNGQKYLLDFVLPNVYFHYTTAYDILRANGMPLSKKDFIGNIF